MKRTDTLWTAAAVALLLSCGGRQEQAETLEARIYQMKPDEVTGVQRMQPSDMNGNVVLDGAEYHYEIHRTPADSLKQVKDEQGRLFADNVITLKVLRNGSQKVLDRRFTKQHFAQQIGADFMKNGILEGLVFDRAESGRLYFAASVCYPQTDLFIPLSVQVSPKGSIHIERIYDMMDDQEVEKALREMEQEMLQKAADEKV